MTDEPKDQMEHIKNLLILLLLRNGTPYTDVAKAVGINVKTLYALFPKSTTKSIEKT